MAGKKGRSDTNRSTTAPKPEGRKGKDRGAKPGPKPKRGTR